MSESVDIDAVVARVGAYLLGITEEEVRSNDRRWAAIHWDDGFFDECFFNIDWENLQVDDEMKNFNRDEGYWFWSRNDFDYGKTIIDWEGFLPGETSDKALKSFYVDGSIYGAHLAELLQQGRVKLEDIDFASILGRLEAPGESLIDALRSLLMLDNFEAQPMELHEFAETDPDHEAFVNSFEPEALRDHISMYFQEPNACRCGGAAPDEIGEDYEILEMFGKPAFRRVLAWWMGEGQGSCYLVEILDDTMPDVPPFDGKSLIYKSPPRLPALGAPITSGNGDELLAEPLFAMLATSESYSARQLGEAALGRDPTSVLAGFAFGPHGVASFGDVASLYREREWRCVAAILHARAQFQTPSARCEDLMTQSNAWIELTCYDHGLQAALQMLEMTENGVESRYPLSHVLNQVAWAAYRAGEYEMAIEHGRRAVAEDPDNQAAHATLGTSLVAGGFDDEGFGILEEVMRAGVDPEPQPELEQSPRYLELAQKHGIPVFER